MNAIYSGFMRLSSSDLVKGLIMAVIGAVGSAVYQLFTTCSSFACIAAFNWYQLLQTAVLVAGTYIVKQLLTTSDGKFLGRIG